MSEQYTPTTEEVRNGYVGKQSARVNFGDWVYQEQWAEFGAEFDRWLAEVKAQAWEEGALWHRANAVFDDRRMKVRFLRDLEVSNPYRQEEN